jgi:hypothetical protein
MKKLLLFLLVLVSSLGVASVAQEGAPPEADPDAQILQAMDFARFGAFFAIGQSDEKSAVLTLEILAERPDGSKRAVVQGSNKLLSNGGFAFRIDYLEPEELAGDVFLFTGEDIFFWNPDLITPLKVNGRFEVFGDATVAEVAGIFFTGSYEIIDRGDTTLADDSPGLWFKLQGIHDGVAFPLVEVTATMELQPENLKLFDESGDLLHDNTFETYNQFPEGPIFGRQLLDNRVVPVNQTLMNLLTFVIEPLEDDLFDPDLLGQ